MFQGPRLGGLYQCLMIVPTEVDDYRPPQYEPSCNFNLLEAGTDMHLGFEVGVAI